MICRWRTSGSAQMSISAAGSLTANYKLRSAREVEAAAPTRANGRFVMVSDRRDSKPSYSDKGFECSTREPLHAEQASASSCHC